MRFHLQLFPPKLSAWVIVLLVLFLPAALTAFILHNLAWLAVVPVAITALALLVAALPIKRKVTPDQFANELESHLLRTGGDWDWDDTTSIAIADVRLERLRWMLPKFDSLKLESDRDELREIIAALRRGEVPEVSWSNGPDSLHHGHFRLKR